MINDLHDLVVEHMASEYEAMGLDVPDKLEQLADGSRQALGCNAVDDYFKANTETKKPKQDVPSRLKLQQWRTSRVAAEAPAPAPVSAPDVTVIAAPAPAPLVGVDAKKALLMAKRKAKSRVAAEAPAPAPAAAESAPREKRAAVSRGSGRGALVVGTVPVSPRKKRPKKK